MFHAIKDFDELTTRNQITQKDIYSYQSIEAVDDVVRPLLNVKTASQEKKEKAGWQPARLDLHVREARV
jgi:hypothetical protein